MKIKRPQKDKTTIKQYKMQLKRFDPIDRQKITRIFSSIKKHFDMELASTVSMQLREYARLIEIEKKYEKEIRKKDFERLRELADSLENWDMDN